jgi:phage portal protein BeeE|nr:MAG TPA: portal protein [Caudoviricetes sp.]
MNKKLLAVAGKEALRLNIGSSLVALKDAFSERTPISPSFYRGLGNLFGTVPAYGGNRFSYVGQESAVKAYQECSPISSIINQKAWADALGQWSIKNVAGKGKGKESDSEIARKIRILFERPNPVQSGTEFFMQVKIHTQAVGHCLIITGNKPVGFPAYDAKSWWIVPPNMYRVVESVFPDLRTGKVIDRVEVTIGGSAIPLAQGEYLLVKDVSPQFQWSAMSESRLKPLSKEVSNIIGAMESRGVLIEQRGPTLVISSGNTDETGKIPLSPDEREALLKDFNTRYGLMREQFKAIITNSAVQVDAVGFNVKDLMLLEEVKDNIERVCDAYGFPFELISTQKGSTFSNGYNADKRLYQNTIIPESLLFVSQLSSWLQLASQGLELSKDFSHVAALQENKKEQSEARRILTESLDLAYKSGVITLNRYRELLGEEPTSDGNVYYSNTSNGTQDQIQAQGATDTGGNVSGNS